MALCNRCLQETRNSWACKGSKSLIEDVGDKVDLDGIWTMFFTGDDSRQEFCASYFRVLHQASFIDILGVMATSGHNCRGFRFGADTRWNHSGARHIFRLTAGRQF
jgi:hypothetical protein